MDINGEYIQEYYRILKGTNLQRSYQEFVKFFRYLRIFLEKEMPDYKFTSNIVENNMDYSYFQFADEKLKSKGLKIVIVFVHHTCEYEVWLSGMNREIQVRYYEKLKNTNNKYTLTTNPNRFDYILKNTIVDKCNDGDITGLLAEMKFQICDFIENIRTIC